MKSYEIYLRVLGIEKLLIDPAPSLPTSTSSTFPFSPPRWELTIWAGKIKSLQRLSSAWRAAGATAHFSDGTSKVYRVRAQRGGQPVPQLTFLKVGQQNLQGSKLGVEGSRCHCAQFSRWAKQNITEPELGVEGSRCHCSLVCGGK